MVRVCFESAIEDFRQKTVLVSTRTIDDLNFVQGYVK